MTAVNPAHVVQGRTVDTAVHAKVRTPGGNLSPKNAATHARKQKEDVLEQMGKDWKSAQSDLRIEVNGANGDVVFQIVSKEDGKVLREIHCKTATPGLLISRMA